MAARKQKRRTYTAEQRERVLADVPKLGVSEAARKHGVPQTSVSVWASARGVQRAGKTERRAGAKSLVAVAASPAVATEKPSASVAAAPRDGRVLRRTRVARLYTPSQKAEVLEYAAAHSVTEASRKFDISRFSIYDWRGKVEKAAKGEGSSPTTGPAPKDIEEQRDREILDEWHKHPGLGPSQIVNQLRRGKIKVSVHTARRVMEDAGYRPP